MRCFHWGIPSQPLLCTTITFMRILNIVGFVLAANVVMVVAAHFANRDATMRFGIDHDNTCMAGVAFQTEGFATPPTNLFHRYLFHRYLFHRYLFLVYFCGRSFYPDRRPKMMNGQSQQQSVGYLHRKSCVACTTQDSLMQRGLPPEIIDIVLGMVFCPHCKEQLPHGLRKCVVCRVDFPPCEECACSPARALLGRNFPNCPNCGIYLNPFGSCDRCKLEECASCYFSWYSSSACIDCSVFYRDISSGCNNSFCSCQQLFLPSRLP